jgi:hypothetical protein
MSWGSQSKFEVMAGEPTQESPSWLTEVHGRLIERNASEVGSHRPAYESYNILWKKSIHLESKRVAVRHALALLEHETSDMVNRGDFETAVNHTSQRILSVHEDLRRFEQGDNNAELDLSKTIYTQRQLISNQEEEIKMAKGEIAELFGKVAERDESLTAELHRKTELEGEVRRLVEALSDRDDKMGLLMLENEQLAKRIMVEKNKSAEEINAMNLLIGVHGASPSKGK